MGFDPASLGMITLAATSAAAGAASASAQKKVQKPPGRRRMQTPPPSGAGGPPETDGRGKCQTHAAGRHTANGRRPPGRRPVLPAPGWFRAGQGNRPWRRACKPRIQDEAAAAMKNAQSLYNRANMEQYMGRASKRAQKTAAAGTLLSGFAQGGNALLKW